MVSLEAEIAGKFNSQCYKVTMIYSLDGVHFPPLDRKKDEMLQDSLLRLLHNDFVLHSITLQQFMTSFNTCVHVNQTFTQMYSQTSSLSIVKNL